MCCATRDLLPPGFCGTLVKKSWLTLVDSQYCEPFSRLAVISQVVFKTSFPPSFRYWPDQVVVYFPSYNKREERLCRFLLNWIWHPRCIIHWSSDLSFGGLSNQRLKNFLMWNSNLFLLVPHWNNVTLGLYCFSFLGCTQTDTSESKLSPKAIS